MKRYKLLIVDDEALIREGLRARIDYFELPDLDAEDAPSGQAALERFRAETIDLAIVDIAMPDMDGLELISRAKALGVQTRFILLSGFAEFAYAQKAISLGVRAYLNKPISNEILKKNLEDLLGELRAEDHAADEAPSYAEGLARDLNILAAGDWETAHPERTFPTLSAHFPEVFSGASWLCLAILHIGPNDTEDPKQFANRLDDVRTAAEKLLTEQPFDDRHIIAASDANPRRLYSLFLDSDPTRLRQRAEQTFLVLRQVMESQMDTRITMGVSRIAHTLTPECIWDARVALRQRRVYGRSNIYFFDDASAYEAQPFPEAELQALRRSMTRGDRADILRQLEILFSESQLKGRKAVYFHVLWVRVVSLMMGIFTDMDAATMNRLLTQVSRAENVTDRAEALRTLTELTDTCLRRRAGKETRAAGKIEHAIRYIREHYNEDIVINDLASRMDMNPTYFSSLFKKETGQSTMQYITALRVDRAREYLAQTPLSVAAIAKNVGYEDSQYFFRVFKKVTGMTPLQYRQNAQDE